ncbi:hypothetical protein [Streptomyces sp. NRRL S-813]|uniref:hypothetical protein n=1 Tax=Streptomyces sp. NRRL S-813 TaxID=1463919 RepID=UPI0004C1750E|nr:hypothetical protein [Streptomyces sp. NRRL S-813]
MVCTLEGRHYFDQQAVEAFWAAWQQDVGTGRLGAAGRRRGDGLGANRSGPGPEQRERAVAFALKALRQAGGHSRGLAARLAREHGGAPRSWQRAVNEARQRYEAEQGEGASGAVS